jgi:hypothetical protein
VWAACGAAGRSKPTLTFGASDTTEAWRVERVDVTVTGANGARATYGALAGAYKQWLGNQVGLKLSLNRR